MNEWTTIGIRKEDKKLIIKLARRNRRSLADQIMVWAEREQDQVEPHIPTPTQEIPDDTDQH